jgi:release factor glutamine methyltransferase
VSTPPETWTIRRVLAWATDDLKSRDTDTPRLDAELLVAHVLGTNRIGLIVDADRPLTKEELARYRELHRRRRAGEPIAYLRGEREFYGRTFRVDARVLVPRPDTEVLVDVALERTRDRSMYGRALDLCTGSGCVAICFGRERPTWHVMGSDISNDALAVAIDNSIRLGAVANVGFVRSNLFSDLGPTRPRFDLVTANPPYIPSPELASLPVTVRNFEPRLALEGGPDGLDLVRRIVTEAPGHLLSGGVLAMEVGFGQAPAVEALFIEAGLTAVERRKDLGGIERVVSGVVP